MDAFNDALSAINGVIWHDIVLYVVLGVGVLFTIWSGLCQYRSLTHGTQVVRGVYDEPDDPGAINHFQALSAALSATVGLGNIGGVAVAIALGGPGAVFWMWMIGLAGMALKTTEVTLSMLYRNTDDPDNPHGGPMWVASKGFAERGLAGVGKVVGGVFCITLLISAITGGNMFQSWNVGEITESYFQIPSAVCGIILAIIVGMVIIGGIKRIGAVAGRLVPFMCVLYLAAAVLVLILKIGAVPAMLELIVVSALPESLGGESANPEGAFLGGTFAYAFLWGLKRALFSSEAGQGSSPIAHSAAKTKEPVREAVVAGIEPFVDTIVVCTLTALVILSSGAWNRGPEATYASQPTITLADRLEPAEGDPIIGRELSRTDESIRFLNASPAIGADPIMTVPLTEVVSIGPAVDEEEDEQHWVPASFDLPEKADETERISGPWAEGMTVFMIVRHDVDPNTGRDLHRLFGTVRRVAGELQVSWTPYTTDLTDDDGQAVAAPVIQDPGIYGDYRGASFTGHAFDRVLPGVGKWLVTIACWLFAISTMISWSYYGEQGMVFLAGEKSVLPYKFVYCVLIVVAALGFIKTETELDNLTALGTGVMLWANIPIMLIFGVVAMRAYHTYGRKLRGGEFHPHAAPSVTDVVEGKDVE